MGLEAMPIRTKSDIKTEIIPTFEENLSNKIDDDNGADSAEVSPSNSEEWLLVSQIGDVIERISSQNPPCASFLNECDYYVSPDKKRVLIKTVGEFGKTMLSAESSLLSLQSAFRMCNITEVGATISIETGASPKEKPPIDELEEL